MTTLSSQQKLYILHHNPHVIAVWQQPLKKGPRVVVVIPKHHHSTSLKLPADVDDEDVEICISAPFFDLRLPLKLADEICYNEPIPGGVQIQPRGANWVGTLGAACSFDSQTGYRRFGILSNWHVMCPSPTEHRHPIHQPQDFQPTMAHLEDWEAVNPDRANYYDAAVADAMIDGLHTIGPLINCVGTIDPEMIDPQMNMPVTKCGRTTGLTHAQCVAVDAAVKVGYGDFTANFTDQAIFENKEVPFSAPGDSGSLILEGEAFRPTALLFAGNAQLTVGSPIKTIAARFNLSFHFPET